MESIKKWTREQKWALVEEFLASGKTKTEWCKEKKLSCSTFYKWRKAYEREQCTIRFVPVEPFNPKIEKNENPVIQSEPMSDSILLEVGSYKIYISEQTPIPFLKEVIKVVDELSV